MMQTTITRVNKLREGFREIINRHLEERDDNYDRKNYLPSEEFPRLPQYVFNMISEINSKMLTNQLNEIITKEQYCSGHVDYVSKFSMYCGEIFLESKKEYEQKS